MSIDKVKIGSLNVRGLRNSSKKKKIYQYLRDHDLDICMLQETHCDKKSENLWSNIWGNKCIYANGETNSRGVAILFTKKTKKCVHEIHRDIEGRYLICKLSLNNETYALANIYAPNDDNPVFFRQVIDKVNEMQCTYTVIGGDFNVVINSEMDRTGNPETKINAQRELIQQIETNELTDVWQHCNPDRRRYTWFGRQPVSCSRIDFFSVLNLFVKQSIYCRYNSEYINGSCFD